jgi:hypothetical protein
MAIVFAAWTFLLRRTLRLLEAALLALQTGWVQMLNSFSLRALCGIQTVGFLSQRGTLALIAASVALSFRQPWSRHLREVPVVHLVAQMGLGRLQHLRIHGGWP